MTLRIAHELPGRIRLRGEPAGFSRLEPALAASVRDLDGVESVSSSRRSGSILISYDPERLERSVILIRLADATAGRYADATACSAPSGEARGGAFCPSTNGDEPEPSLGGALAPLALRPFMPRRLGQALAVRRALPRLLRGLTSLACGRLSIDVLDAAAIGICILRRDFRSLSTITALLDVGDFLEGWTRRRSEESLAETLVRQTVWARVRRGDVEEEIDSRLVQTGDEVVVRQGALIPVDGLVVEGEALVDQSPMTGESRLIAKRAGSAVFAGTILEEGELAIRSSDSGDRTRWRRTLSLVRDAERRKADVQGQAERLAGKLAPFSLGLAALAFALTRDPRRAASVLMVDYSCAIKLATPLAVLSAMRQAAEIGAVVKGGRHLEDLAKADVFVFDKTGTLTVAEPAVQDVCAFGGWTREEVLRLAACLEEHFPHPVARAVVRQATQEGLEHREDHASVEYVMAHGVASWLDGKRVLLGSRHFVHEDEKVSLAEAEAVLQDYAEKGYSVLYLAVGGELVGCVALDDPPRPEAGRVVSALRELGVKRIIMLTGDLDNMAAKTAAELGITEWVAQALPDEKHQVIEKLLAEGSTVAMIGDGLNDAAALARASVGICMRQGADIAREAADVVLTSGDLMVLPAARALAQATLARINSNFGFIIGVNSLLLAGGLFGALPPTVSALLHNGATVAAAVAALRPLPVPDPSDEGGPA